MIELKLDKDVLKNVDIYFNALSSDEQRRVLVSSYMKGVKPMISTARNLAPFRTGKLFYSIAAERAPNKMAGILFGIKTGGIYVGWYGKWQNEGTKQRYWRHKSKKSTGKVRADNFIKDAYEWNIDGFMNTSEKELQAYINRQIEKYTHKR